MYCGLFIIFLLKVEDVISSSPAISSTTSDTITTVTEKEVTTPNINTEGDTHEVVHENNNANNSLTTVMATKANITDNIDQTTTASNDKEADKQTKSPTSNNGLLPIMMRPLLNAASRVNNSMSGIEKFRNNMAEGLISFLKNSSQNGGNLLSNARFIRFSRDKIINK